MATVAKAVRGERMIAIKYIQMPPCCILCPCFTKANYSDGGLCKALMEAFRGNIYGERYKACPLIEIKGDSFSR